MASAGLLACFKVLLIMGSLVAVLIRAEPFKYTLHTFENCRPGLIMDKIIYCCIPWSNLQGPVVDFVPWQDPSKPLRVRKALQCLEGAELEAYTVKLQRAYELMRALPNEDPRSLYFQSTVHCAYGSGSLAKDTTNITTDIHFSWFFYPWHRFYIFFHERMLQSLLNDSDFSLHFWNYDNSITLSPTPDSSDGCFKAGHFVPSMYNDPTKSTFSDRLAIATDPTAILDLVTPFKRNDYPRLADEEIIAGNRAALHAAMITDGNASRTFLGRSLSVGDVRGEFPRDSGTFENVHSSVHFWIGKMMKTAEGAAMDPIFYAHHVNVDRIWTLWQGLGPDRWFPTDNRDWMDAEFLFWDENKAVWRVKVKDSLTTEAFGYVYQKVNDNSWIFV